MCDKNNLLPIKLRKLWKLSDANRKSSFNTPFPGPEFCDNQLPVGWYRFVGAAGTKMPTTRVPPFRCGTLWSGWLYGAHPTVDDDEVCRKVCFRLDSDRSTGCRYIINILVKNCGSFFIYMLVQPPKCHSTVARTKSESKYFTKWYTSLRDHCEQCNLRLTIAHSLSYICIYISYIYI